MERVGWQGWSERVGLQGGVESGCAVDLDVCVPSGRPLWRNGQPLWLCGGYGSQYIDAPLAPPKDAIDGTCLLMELDPDSGGRPSFKIAKYLSDVSSANTQDPKSEDAVKDLVYTLSLIAGSPISRRSSEFIKTSWASRERIWARASATCEEEFWERWEWRVEGRRR